MTLKEQTIFFGIICASLLIGALLNEKAHKDREFEQYLKSNYSLFGNPNFQNPLSEQIPLVAPAYAQEDEKDATKTAKLKEAPNPIIKHTELILKYLPKYYPKLEDQSRMMPIFSCLMRNEARHGMNKNCGDGGKACGSAQFHEPTYKAYRKIMIARGLASEMGSRLNPENAIETMIWAFSDGRGTAWGPYSRGECR